MSARLKALNPQADRFQPSNALGMTTDMANAASNQQQLHSINEADDENNLHAQFVMLRDAMTEELCLLRRDLNLIVNGGWQLTIGPWQMMQPATQLPVSNQDVKNIRDRISKAMDGEGKVGFDETKNKRPKLITDGKPVTSPDAGTVYNDVKTTTTSESKSVQSSQLFLTTNGLTFDNVSTSLTVPGNNPPGTANPPGLSTASVTGIRGRPIPQETAHQVVKAYAAGPAQNVIQQDVQSLGAQRAQTIVHRETKQTMPTGATSGTVAAGTTSISDASPAATTAAKSPSPRLIVQTTEKVAEHDTPKPSVEDCAITVSTTNWMPRAIRDLKPMATASQIPSLVEQVPFTWDFLADLLRGIEHSPGLYYSPKSTGTAVLEGRTYCIIDHTYEPYIPKVPGHHGAKLTAFFNNNPTADGDDICYENLPLFITSNGKDFYYFGQYSQKRWSDKLDYDRMSECVPDAVKMHHAELLADPARPKWVTDQLMTHFWPKPEFYGSVVKIQQEALGSTQPTQINGNINEHGVGALGGVEKEEKKARKVRTELDEYMMDLRAWEKEAKMKVGYIKKETILEAFEEVSGTSVVAVEIETDDLQADAADPPGLRLWWEYLQCVGFDQSFYTAIAKLQLKARSATSAAPTRRGPVEELID